MNLDLIMLLGLVLVVGGTVVLIVWALAGLGWQMPEEDRGYLDPLPPLLRPIWPLVRFFSHYIGSRVPTSLLERAYQQIARAGANYMFTAEEFYSLRILGALLAGGLLWLAVHRMGAGLSVPIAVFGLLLGFFYPSIWLNRRNTTRRKSILKQLPMFLDYIILGVEAGMNFTGALGQTVDKGPVGPLRQEFFLVLRDVRAGLSRADALRRMEERLMIPEISSFVSSIIQAEQVGASMGKILRLQADRRRSERFQRAEKLAMEAPVKLIFPLVVFIFPTTFIILAFPIFMMVKQQGL